MHDQLPGRDEPRDGRGRPRREPAVEIGAQAHGQIAVQLNHVQGCAAFQQRPGQCAGTGADLDQDFARLRVEGIEDALHDAVVVQEVLAEALLGLKWGI